MAQVDLFEDLAYHVAIGIDEVTFLKKVALIKKYTSLSYDRIYRMIDDSINRMCWAYEYDGDLRWRCDLPFSDMVGKKHWELSKYVDGTYARPYKTQVEAIWIVANS